MRTIKPEFWTDGDVMRMSSDARLMFIGTWNFSLCDFGHVPYDPERLRAQIFPANPEVDGKELLDEIIRLGRLRYVELTDGRPFLIILRFTEHQKIDRRWSPRCPACRSGV